MTFEEFYKNCSFDICQLDRTNETQVTCIFSLGMLRKYSDDFVDAHEDISKRLVAEDLYNYTRKAME